MILLDVLLFREALEPGAAELAARRDDLTEQQKDTLMTCLQEAGDVSADSCRLTDSRLHIYIAELSGSQRLVDSIADVQLMPSDVLSAIPLLEDAIVHSNDQHAAIVKAILSGQADEARKVMSSHATLLRCCSKAFSPYSSSVASLPYKEPTRSRRGQQAESPWAIHSLMSLCTSAILAEPVASAHESHSGR